MSLLERRPPGCRPEGGIPVLETRRLILRAPRLADVAAIAALANDRRIAENTARLPHPYAPADAEDFVALANTGSETVFAVTLADERVIGCAGLLRVEGRLPEIGYWLGVPHWGHGYATEAARALIDFAFADPAIEQLAASARVSNPASRRVLEKCGFQWAGVELRRIRALASSAPFDRFRLDRRLWASLKSWGDPRSA